MIAELRPYAEYKESELPWLGPVPRHWDMSPLATLARLKSVVNQSERQLLSVYLQRGVVRFADVDEKRTNATSEDLSKYQAVDPGDFVLNNQQAWRGSVGVSEHSGIVSPAYLVLALSKRYLASYANLLFRDQSMVSHYLVCSKGVGTIQRNLYWPQLKRVGALLPPPDEQAAIVRFLDWANERLERAIRAKRKVIALLGEQKQAIIHRAVTRGLDTSVPLKPSGIPWLGDIPQHWEIRQLRHMGRLHKGVGGSKEDATAMGVPCVRYGELYFHYQHFIRQPRGFVSADKAASYTPIHSGDVLFAASGERVEEIGKSAVNLYRGAAVCGGDVVIFRPTVDAHAAFLGYALDSYGAAHQKATMCRGTTIKHIYPDELRGLWLCVPPVPEQERIAASLDSELLGRNAAGSRLAREIDLLREYRTRLFADVVTGKLDVREAAARLPDVAPRDTAEDDADLADEPEAADEEAAV